MDIGSSALYEALTMAPSLPATVTQRAQHTGTAQHALGVPGGPGWGRPAESRLVTASGGSTRSALLHPTTQPPTTERIARLPAPGSPCAAP